MNGTLNEAMSGISVGLLRTWWLEATQALVDTVGSEEALSLLKPHFVHAGHAGRRVYHGITRLDLGGVDSANAAGYALAPSLGGRFSPMYLAKDGSGMGEMHDCGTSGACKEACIAVCSWTAEASLKEMNPDWEIRLERCLSSGDSLCRWKVWRRGTEGLVKVDEGMRIPPEDRFPDPLDDATRDYLALAYAGEYWVMATRAILDSPSADAAMRSLRERARLSGMSLGLRLAEISHASKEKHTALDVIRLTGKAHQRREEIVMIDGAAEGTVSECPFAGSAPLEICHQYEEFFNGVCEVLSPGSEFRYDRRMTQGEECCHWSLRPRAGPTMDAGIP